LEKFPPSLSPVPVLREPVNERRADDRSIGGLADHPHVLRRGDAEPHANRNLRARLNPANQLHNLRGDIAAISRHPGARNRVHKAAGPATDFVKPLIGASGGDEKDVVEALVPGCYDPVVGLLRR